LVSISLTLNDLESVLALILRCLPNSIALQADNVTVVEDRPIMSAKYRLPLHLTKCNWGDILPTQQSRGFFATAKLFVYLVAVKAGDKLVDYFQQILLALTSRA